MAHKKEQECFFPFFYLFIYLFFLFLGVNFLLKSFFDQLLLSSLYVYATNFEEIINSSFILCSKTYSINL